MLTESERQAIRERVEAATPGPWVAHPSYEEEWWWTACPVGTEGESFAAVACDKADTVGPNAAFIAAARTDIPALLADGDELRALLREALPALIGHANESLNNQLVYAPLYNRITAALSESPRGDGQ